jgi:hypothetical protein
MTLQDVFGSLPLPSGRVLRWLLGQGVPFDSLYSVKAAWVTFDGAGFDFDPVMTGSPVLIFRCADNGHTPDICAWSIRHNKLATCAAPAFASVMLINASILQRGLRVVAFASTGRRLTGSRPAATAS